MMVRITVQQRHGTASWVTEHNSQLAIDLMRDAQVLTIWPVSWDDDLRRYSDGRSNLTRAASGG